MAKLTAGPQSVFIDVEAGETHDTATISYIKEPDDMLWERLDFDAWIPRDINTSSPTDPRHRQGDFPTQPIGPGNFYEAIVLNADYDANQSIEPATARVGVAGLREQPEEREFIKDTKEIEGGTWAARDAVCDRPVIAVLQVSSTPPYHGANGYAVFDTDDLVGNVYRDFGTTHNLEVRGLLPGNTYHELFRVSDGYGNWELRERTLTTLRRVFTVRLVEIDVHDDGDDLSDGEGSFTIELATAPEGPDPTGQDVPWKGSGTRITYHNSKFTTGQHLFPTGYEATFGPYAAAADSRAIGVLAEGTETEDGSPFLDGEDITGLGKLKLELRDGRNREVIKHGPRKGVYAPDVVGDFRFTAFVTYAVEYVP
jgi:hypothetical protein